MAGPEAPKRRPAKAQASQASIDGALRQVAALPVRRHADGTWQVLLVTSRETRRWVIPKGWPMRGLKDRKAAALEAKQEAGVVGRAGKAPIGSYLYWKRRERHFDLVHVEIYLLAVERHLTRWKEKGQRELRWFPLPEAVLAVDEPGLSALIENLSVHGDAEADPQGMGFKRKPSKRRGKGFTEGG